MERHSSAIVTTEATAATSVAEIEKFLSRRQSQQQRRCILLMETTSNFSSDGSDKNASQDALHITKTCGSSSRHTLKERGKVVVLICKLEALNFLKHHFKSISTWLTFKRTLSHEVEALVRACEKSRNSACS